MKEPWVDEYLVHSYEIDMDSRLSIVSAINFFQESAWRNAESLGVGFNDLAEKNRFWVLSRLYVEMYRYPLWGDAIKLETWPKGMENMFAMRDFRLKTADGNDILGAGVSAWLVIDATTHRLLRVEQICDLIPCYPHNAVEYKLGKIVLAPVMTPQTRIIAGYTDVDVNNHVNNVSYLNWAVNYLPAEVDKLTVRSAELNFLSEARLRSPVEILYGNIDEKNWICSLRNTETGKEYCRVRLNIEY